MHDDGELQEISGEWLGRFFKAMRTDARRAAAKAYLLGLLDNDPRKSLRAIAARTDQVAYHQLHHFFDSKSKKDKWVWKEIIDYANQHFNRWPACLTIEDIVLPKAGDKSAGAARQVVAATGQRMNCQIVVSLAMVRGGHVIPVAMRLIPPATPATSSGRGSAHKTNLNEASSQRKAIIVSGAIDHFVKQGGLIDYVIADDSYFACYEFRKCLKEHGIDWIACIGSNHLFTGVRQKSDVVYDAGISPHEQISGSILLDRRAELYRPTLYDSSVVDEPCFSANAVVYRGCAAVRKMGIDAQSDMQLAVALHNDGTECSYLSNMHVGSHVRRILREVKNQRTARRAYAHMIKLRGLTKYEGRSELGLYRHFLIVTIAYIYECHLKLDNYSSHQRS